MSRNGLLVVAVIVIAVIVSAYFTFGRNSSGTATPTPAPSVATAASPTDLASLGAVLFTQYRCNVCHTTNGNRAAGPTLAGLFGSQVTLDTGKTVTANEGYLSESITNPDAQIVSGYGPSVMSAALADISTKLYQGNNVAALVAYIESLK